MAQRQRSLETWEGYYLHLSGEGKSWSAEIAPCGTGVGPAEKICKTVKGKTLDEVRAAARKAAASLPRL